MKSQIVISSQTSNALDSLNFLFLIIFKVPRYNRDRWSKQATIRKSKSRALPLSDLIAFLEEETLVVNDPFFSINTKEE